jgi:tRNA(fMet)-specific endonuclease VapC
MNFAMAQSGVPIPSRTCQAGSVSQSFHLPFDDQCARRCAEIRAELERNGRVIGPHDLQIAAIALQHGLTLVTHNTRESSRVSGLKLED